MTHSQELKELVLIYVKQNPQITIKDIAKKFYVSAHAVHSWMKQASIIREPVHIKLLKERSLIINENSTITSLVKEFKVGRTAVSKYLKVHNFKVKKEPLYFSTEFKDEVVKYRKENPQLTLKSISVKFNVSTTSVRKWSENK